MERIEVTT